MAYFVLLRYDKQGTHSGEPMLQFGIFGGCIWIFGQTRESPEVGIVGHSWQNILLQQSFFVSSDVGKETRKSINRAINQFTMPFLFAICQFAPLAS